MSKSTFGKTNRKYVRAILNIVSVLIAFVFVGCGTQSENTNLKNTNANRNVTTVNTFNENTIVNPANENTIVNPANNTVANTAPMTNTTGANVPATNNTPVKNKTAASGAEPAPQIGSGGNDLLLTLQAKNALGAEKSLIDSVIIDIKEGNAVLSGKVSSAAEKDKAAQIIKNVKGIKSVKNNLTVLQ